MNRIINSRRPLLAPAFAVLAAGMAALHADDRRFTYSYEPETLPQGVTEFEQWVTWRAQRNAAVDQGNFSRFDLREEVEYGVTDNYTVSLYLNNKVEHFREVSTASNVSEFTFDGISIENRYMVLNPADHAVGLTLYLEPRFSGVETELEQKVILGQRHGDWKWAFNLTHSTEWGDHFRAVAGEVEVSLGLAHQLGKRWSLGIEVLDTNDLPEYAKWENTVIYLGPVVSYHTEKWWAALTVMPQVYGINFDTDADGERHLELSGHERVNVRLLFGVTF